jgi:hypothetical protein
VDTERYRLPKITPELLDTLQFNERLSVLFSHLLVSLMLTTFTIGLVLVGNRLLQGWDGRYLPWIAFVVSMEALYSKRATRSLALLSREWIVYRGAEMFLLLAGTKLLLYAIQEPAQLWSDLARWPEQFGTTFFTGEYVFAALFVFVIWFYSSTFAEDLAELEGDEQLLVEDIASAITTDRRMIRQQLVDRVILTGALLVVLTALVRLDLLTDYGFNPALRTGVLHVLAYFLFALIFLSLTQFGILRASWTIERTVFGRNVGTRWLTFSLVFLVLLSALAWILPTRYTLGLLSILQFILGLVLFVIGTLWGWGMLFLAFLLSLLGFRNFEPQPTANEPILPNLPPVISNEAAPILWLEALKSIVFWTGLIGLVVFSIYQYINQNPLLLERLRRMPLANWLRQAWAWLRSWLKGVNQVVNAAVVSRMTRLRRLDRHGQASGWGYVNLRRLTPRQRVVFYYLALVCRGGERGFNRRSAQTPYEYQELLQAALDGNEEELAGLTGAFVEARYSQHHVTAEQASRVRRWWERVGKRLRR